MANWKNEKPTYRQLNLIKDIENEFGVEFTGKTKGEAAEYIDKWLTIAHNDIDRSINWDAESRFG